MAFYLSKSKYCQAIQCPKMLWLSKYKSEEFDNSVTNQTVLDTGNEVGDLAMGLLGDYTEVPYGDLTEMLEITKTLIENNTKIIAEASFSCDGLFCSVDILKNLGNHQVEIYEVKSSTSVHSIYYDDISYQCYVLTRLGFKVIRACIVHINNQYVRHGELDLKSLFQIEDVSHEVKTRLPEVEDNIKFLKNYMQQTCEPCNDIGPNCFSPYNCGFFGYCTKHLPKPNVFDVAGLRAAKKLDLYKSGVISFEDLAYSQVLPQNRRQQVEFEVYDLPPHIETEPICEFLDTLFYPLYFLDFETFQPAIPQFDNSHPYEQITFQYSLHYIDKEDGELKHKEFLAHPGDDPRRALAEQLCEDIPMNACTTAYNMGFEKGRISSLAQLYPDLAPHLMNIHDNIHDLMIPFQKKYYYTKAMQGSYSIKYVLPALFPDDPTLDYHNLEGVHNGGEASSTFKQMAAMPPEELDIWRNHLLNYCGLDTFAMVKVWEKLNEVAGHAVTWR